MRRHERYGLLDAGQLDDVQRRELRQRILDRCIDLQWLGYACHASAEAVHEQPMRKRRERCLRRQLYGDFMPRGILLRFHWKLRSEEAQWYRQHVFYGGRVFLRPLLGRRALLQFGLHGTMPDLQ
jgi:hypothetical protein